MGDLTAALGARSRDSAADRAGDYAGGNRAYAVEIRRPALEPVYDRATHELRRPPPELVYTGPARITAVTPTGMREVGDAPQWWADARVSIGPDTELEPRADDVVTITDTPLAQAGNVAGRQLRVIGVARGGHLSIGLSLSVTGIEPSRETPEEP